MTSKYKLLEPMLGWTKGELFVLDTEWANGHGSVREKLSAREVT